MTTPARDWMVVLAATTKETEPSPLPLVPELIVIQLSLLDAVQLQPVGEVKSMLPLPPPESKDALPDDRE